MPLSHHCLLQISQDPDGLLRRFGVSDVLQLNAGLIPRAQGWRVILLHLRGEGGGPVFLFFFFASLTADATVDERVQLRQQIAHARDNRHLYWRCVCVSMPIFVRPPACFLCHACRHAAVTAIRICPPHASLSSSLCVVLLCVLPPQGREVQRRPVHRRRRGGPRRPAPGCQMPLLVGGGEVEVATRGLPVELDCTKGKKKGTRPCIDRELQQ